MKCLKYLLLVATLAAGCGDGGTSKPLVSPDGVGVTPDGGGSNTPDGGAPAPDGGGVTPDAAATAGTLVEFVTDIVKNKTNETALPESIDDKVLIDTMDPAAFNGLF